MASASDVCLKEYDGVFAPGILDGKVAFVTGGGSGICFRVTEMLMRHGCNTAIASRKMDRVTEAAGRLESATGKRCVPIAMDVRKPEEVDAGMKAVLEAFGRIDIVINGAAGNFLCHAGALSPGAFKTVMEIDAHGTFFVSRAAYEHWMKDHGGTIINISATLYYRGVAMQAHAGAAKAAIDAMTRHLAREWGPNGVRVNSIAPGPIDDTEGMRRLGGFLPAEVIEQYKKAIPAQRLGDRQDIGNAVLYLASKAGSYVSGHVLVVDGGEWMSDASLDQGWGQSKL